VPPATFPRPRYLLVYRSFSCHFPLVRLIFPPTRFVVGFCPPFLPFLTPFALPNSYPFVPFPPLPVLSVPHDLTLLILLLSAPRLHFPTFSLLRRVPFLCVLPFTSVWSVPPFLLFLCPRPCLVCASVLFRFSTISHR